MKKALLILSVVCLALLFVHDVNSASCVPTTITKCKDSNKISRDACSQVVGIPIEYSGDGCKSYAVDFDYNVKGSKCEESSLKIAKYTPSGSIFWSVLPNTKITKNGDKTGKASAIIGSDGIYALVSSNKDCAKQCAKTVYAVPSTVAVGDDITLGACGNKFERENNVVKNQNKKTCSEILAQLNKQTDEPYCCNSCKGGILNDYGKTTDCPKCCAAGCIGEPLEETLMDIEIDENINFDNVAPVLFVVSSDECSQSANQQGEAGQQETPIDTGKEATCTCDKSGGGAGENHFTCKDISGSIIEDRYCAEDEICTGTISSSSSDIQWPCKPKTEAASSEKPSQTTNTTTSIPPNIKMCPAGYKFGGAFRYGTSCDQQESLIAFSRDFKQKKLKKGWVTLCTKGNFAYLDATRNDCVYDKSIIFHFLHPDKNELTPVMPGIVNTCTGNSVVCGMRSTIGLTTNIIYTKYWCCKLADILVDTSIQGDINPQGKRGEDYCNGNGEYGNLIATSFKGGVKWGDAVNYISDFICNGLKDASVGLVTKSKTKYEHEQYTYFIPRPPNSAICGGMNGQVKPRERIANVYFCPIEQNKPCKTGYELVGSIRVGDLTDARCEAYYDAGGSSSTSSGFEYGISSDGKKIAAGLIGLCIRKALPQTTSSTLSSSDATDSNNANQGTKGAVPANPSINPQPPYKGPTITGSATYDAEESEYGSYDTQLESDIEKNKATLFVALNVGLGNVEAIEGCPEGYHLIATISGKGSNEENLDFAYIGSASPIKTSKTTPTSASPTLTPTTPTPTQQTQVKNIRSGTIGVCVADDKPHSIFCSTKDFNARKVKCISTEYCRDTQGKFECIYNPSEEGTFDFYAFICDFTGCPSQTYRSGSNLYYGKSSFKVIAQKSDLGELGDGTALGMDGIPPMTPASINETSLPEEENKECIDNDNDGFFGIGENCADGNDCNDADMAIHPGAEEICGNEIDEDCSGSAELCGDCQGTAIDEDQDGSCSDVDCDDKNASISPNAVEICGNEIDENCDGKAEVCIVCNEGDLISCFPEHEDYFYAYHKICSKDGIYGKCAPDYELGINPLSPRPRCTSGQKWTCPRQFGICQGSITTCTNGEWPDCDYTTITSYSATETCGDALDNDCDGSIDEGCPCNAEETKDCGSSIGSCTPGKQTCKNGKLSECDFSSAYYPKPESLLDGKDNDCDGSIDEGFDCSAKYKLGFSRKCGISGISPCNYGKQYCTDKLFSGLTVFGVCEGSINPQPEICDDEDNDCDGSIDEGCPCDQGQAKACGIAIGECEKGKQDCVDGIFGVCEGATIPTEELCGDQLDNDCDGSIDEGCPCIDLEGKNLTTWPCTKQNGICNGINQTCKDGSFQECDYSKITNYEAIETKCSDQLDNDCDGKIDGEDLTNCASTSNAQCIDGTIIGECSGSKLCSKDAQLEDKCEKCDNCDPEYENCYNGKCIELKRPATRCNNDGICDAEQGETSTNCQYDCLIEKICNNDGICDAEQGETADNCPSDCPLIAEEEPSNWIWYLLLLIFILLVVACVVYYNKYKNKKTTKKEAEKPQFRTVLRPSEVRSIEKPVEIKRVEKANIQQLYDYVRRSLESGKNIDEIKNLSLKSGWSEEEIDDSIKKAKPDVSRKEALKKLYLYIESQLNKGESEFVARQKLIKAGWNKADIEKATISAKNNLKEFQRQKAAYTKKQEEEKLADKLLQERLAEKGTKKRK